jgi:hypothetical protein
MERRLGEVRFRSESGRPVVVRPLEVKKRSSGAEALEGGL